MSRAKSWGGRGNSTCKGRRQEEEWDSYCPLGRGRRMGPDNQKEPELSPPLLPGTRPAPPRARGSLTPETSQHTAGRGAPGSLLKPQSHQERGSARHPDMAKRAEDRGAPAGPAHSITPWACHELQGPH